MIVDIVHYPNAILTKRAEDCLDMYLQESIIEDLIDTVHHHNGLGLAAPQINQPFNIFVIRKPDFNVRAFINPIITSYSADDVEVAAEGCLSLPGELYLVARPKTINVKFDDENGEHICQFTGLISRIFQHEYDHLNGILIKDIGKRINNVCNTK